MTRPLIHITLSPQQQAKLSSQEIAIYPKKTWLWIEVMFLPAMLSLYLVYIIPFRNTFTIVAFGVVIALLMFPFLNARKRLKFHAPAIKLNKNVLAFDTNQIRWQEVKSGQMISGTFGDQLEIVDIQQQTHRISLSGLNKSPWQIYVLVCKYYSLEK